MAHRLFDYLKDVVPTACWTRANIFHLLLLLSPSLLLSWKLIQFGVSRETVGETKNKSLTNRWRPDGPDDLEAKLFVSCWSLDSCNTLMTEMIIWPHEEATPVSGFSNAMNERTFRFALIFLIYTFERYRRVCIGGALSAAHFFFLSFSMSVVYCFGLPQRQRV